MKRYGAMLAVFILLAGLVCCRAQQQQSCTVDGVTYEDGSSWPSLDGCQQCRCSSGLTFCVRVSFCRELGQCGVIVTLPGACCPVCFGCVSPSGRKMSLNETWMEDDCTTCICRDGQSKCQASFCRTPCLQPRKVPGECCPVCDDDCHLQCLYGRAVDPNGRELCECRKVPDEDFRDLQVTIQTKVIDQDGDGVDGQETDGDFVMAGANEAINCPKVACKRMCAHGFQTDERGCPVCKCQRCKSIQPCHKKCALGLVHDGRGCPTCHCRPGGSTLPSQIGSGAATRLPSMTSSFSVSSSTNGKCLAGGGNLTYNYGDRWQMDDCTHCVCHPGGPTCTEMACPLPCHNAIFVPGQCCPVCDDSSRTSATPTGGSSNQQRNETRDGMADGTALLTVVLVCVALVAGLILIVAILAVCVARQCQRLQQHEESMAAAAVKLTAVNQLRPKSTNLDYQYNLYLHRYRETVPNGWPFDGSERSTDSQDKDEGGSSQCSNSPLLMVKSA